MTAGIIFPSITAGAEWTAITGSWLADYPLANVGDLIRPSKVARGSSTTSRRFAAVLPASRSLAAVALIGHNVPAGAGSVRVYAFSGTGYDPVTDAATIVFDSGVLPVWPALAEPVEGMRNIRPILLPSPVAARAVRIEVTGQGVALELEGVELGGLWKWPGVSYGRQMGILGGDEDTELIGGGSEPAGDSRARTVDAQVDLMSMAITSTTGLDFQRATGLSVPFVWAEDFLSPQTWARRCLLARNRQLPSIPGRLYRHDAFPVRLIEHLR